MVCRRRPIRRLRPNDICECRSGAGSDFVISGKVASPVSSAISRQLSGACMARAPVGFDGVSPAPGKLRSTTPPSRSAKRLVEHLERAGFVDEPKQNRPLASGLSLGEETPERAYDDGSSFALITLNSPSRCDVSHTANKTKPQGTRRLANADAGALIRGPWRGGLF